MRQLQKKRVYRRTRLAPVVVCVVQKDDRILMIRRQLANDRLSDWMFPGGKIEDGESPENAGAREALEETGAVCRAVKVIGKARHPISKRAITYVLYDYESGKVHVPISERQAIDYVAWLKPEHVASLVRGSLSKPLAYFFRERTTEASQALTQISA